VKIYFFLLFTSLACLVSSTQDNGRVRRLNGSQVSSTTLTASLQHTIDTARITGLSIAIINDGKVVYKNTFGLRNKETAASLNDSTEMYAASLTKPIAAVVFLKLAESGTFNLDTSIFKYLKSPIGSYDRWKDLASDKPFEKVTARMLLSHSSGLPIVRFIYRNKVNLIAEPGTKFYYSNEGMNLLGFIVEEYTGKKLQHLAEELIFKPLSMKHTSMVWQEAFDANHALGYGREGELIGMEKRTSARAAGSMTTTASDYARFAIALMNKKLLSGAMLHDMLTPQIKIISSRGFGPQRDSTTNKYNQYGLSWGLGVALFHSKYGKAFYHGGHDDGWQNYFVAYPDKKIAVVIMSNSSNFEHAAHRILDVCISDKSSPLEWLGYFDNN